MSQIKGVLGRYDGANPVSRISSEDKEELLRSFQANRTPEDGQKY